MYEVEVTKTLKITNDNIDEIMDTAVEYGVFNWCIEVGVVGKQIGKFPHEQISGGGVLKFYPDDSEMTYDLTLDKFLKGVQMWFEKEVDWTGVVQGDGTIYWANGTSVVADQIVQYGLFGEIMYP